MKTFLGRWVTPTGLVAAITGLCIALSAASVQAADAKPITIRFAGTLPVAHHITKSQYFFKKLVEERSNGRIKVQVYPAGQLYKDLDLVDVIPSGSVEMAIANLGQWSGLIPQLAIFDLSGAWADQAHFYRMLDDQVVQDVIAKGMKKNNVVLLNFIDYGASSCISKKPLNKLGDFKGLRIRASTEYNTIQVKALGGASAVLSAPEVYQALSLGTIDGAMTGPTAMVARKLYEVANYEMRNVLGFGNFGTVVNLKWWNSLPADMQDVLKKAGQDTQAWTRKASQEADVKAWDKLSAIPGNHVYTVEPGEFARWAKIVLPPQTVVMKERAGKDGEVLLGRVEALRTQ